MRVRVRGWGWARVRVGVGVRVRVRVRARTFEGRRRHQRADSEGRRRLLSNGAVVGVESSGDLLDGEGVYRLPAPGERSPIELQRHLGTGYRGERSPIELQRHLGQRPRSRIKVKGSGSG